MEELKKYLNQRNNDLINPQNLVEYRLQTLGPVFEELKKHFSKPYKIELTSHQIIIKNEYDIIIELEYLNKKLILTNKDEKNLKQTNQIIKLVIKILQDLKINHSLNNQLLNALKDRENILQNTQTNISKNEFIKERCMVTEYLFTKMFDTKSHYYHKGILIYQNNKLLGIFKFKGEKLILSLKLNSNDIPLEKFGLYDFEDKLKREVNKFSLLKTIEKMRNKEYYRVNIIGTPKFRPIQDFGNKLFNQEKFTKIKFAKDPPIFVEIEHWAEFKKEIQEPDFLKKLIENLKNLYEQNKNRTDFDKVIKLK